MRFSREERLALCGALLLGCVSAALAEEEQKKLPPLAKLTERKLTSDQYQAVLFGKVALLKGKKPLETGAALRLNFAKKDAQDTAVSIDVKDNDTFVLDPGTVQGRDNNRLFRSTPDGAVAFQRAAAVG